MRDLRLFVCLGALVVLAACDGTLRDLDVARGSPEEFAIIPNKPLTVPERMGALPVPTPGGANRTDPTPQADLVAALGGNPAALNPGGVPAADQALVARAGRFGRDGGIRTTLAREDADFRRRRAILNYRVIRQNEYNRAYQSQALDGQRWLERVRRPGSNVRTPSAPPPGG